MKFMTLTLAVLFAATADSAQAAPTIKDNMKAISTLVKAITKNVSNAAQNQASAKQADQVVTLFTACIPLIPDVVKSLPVDQQAASEAGYQALIQKEIVDATALKAAFTANDNAQAATILQDMNTIKSEGHSQYDP